MKTLEEIISIVEKEPNRKNIYGNVEGILKQVEDAEDGTQFSVYWMFTPEGVEGDNPAFSIGRSVFNNKKEMIPLIDNADKAFICG